MLIGRVPQKEQRPPHPARLFVAERSRTIEISQPQSKIYQIETPTARKMLGQFVSGLFQALPRSIGALSIRQLGTIFNAIPMASNTVAGGSWSLMPVRTNVRYHFPIARETKRIKVNGWKKRMSTLSGRKIIMRRILKGCHVLSH